MGAWQLQVLASSNAGQIKPLSAILWRLWGVQKARLTEYDLESGCLPLYLDFVADAGESCSELVCFQAFPIAVSRPCTNIVACMYIL